MFIFEQSKCNAFVIFYRNSFTYYLKNSHKHPDLVLCHIVVDKSYWIVNAASWINQNLPSMHYYLVLKLCALWYFVIFCNWILKCLHNVVIIFIKSMTPQSVPNLTSTTETFHQRKAYPSIGRLSGEITVVEWNLVTVTDSFIA